MTSHQSAADMAAVSMASADVPWYFEPEVDPLRLRRLAWRHIRSDPWWHDALLVFVDYVEKARASHGSDIIQAGGG